MCREPHPKAGEDNRGAIFKIKEGQGDKTWKLSKFGLQSKNNLIWRKLFQAISSTANNRDLMDHGTEAEQV